MADHQRLSTRVGQVAQRRGLGIGESHRDFEEHVFVRLERGPGLLVVNLAGRGNEHGVHARPSERLAEVERGERRIATGGKFARRLDQPADNRGDLDPLHRQQRIPMNGGDTPVARDTEPHQLTSMSVHTLVCLRRTHHP